MDDNTFDQKTAEDWMTIVESEKGRIRDGDIYPMLRAWIERVAPATVLEIGAGQGVCSDHVGACKYVGVDPSPFLIHRARTLYRDANRDFIQGSVYDLPFRANAFDAVFSIVVWHLLSNIQTAAIEMSRVLRAGGHFLIVTANPSAYAAWTGVYTHTRSEGRRFEGRLQNFDGSVSQDVLHLHTMDEITASLEAAHCRIKCTETFRSVDVLGGCGKFVLIEGQK